MGKKIVEYEHHGYNVKVREDLKGKHSENCLCFQDCVRFRPEDREKNCPIANELYEFCVKYNVVTPVWECPLYRRKDV